MNWHLTALLFATRVRVMLTTVSSTGHGRIQASSACSGSVLTPRPICCMCGSRVKWGSKGQILLCYFQEVRGTGGEAGEERVKNIHHSYSYDPKRNSTSAFKHKMCTSKNKNHTYLSPKTLTPFPPEKLRWTEMVLKKSLLTDTVPEVLRCWLAVVIQPHPTPNHVLHRECPRYLAAFPWLVSKCWGPSAFLCKMFPPEDHSPLRTELLQSLHMLELPLELTGGGNKDFKLKVYTEIKTSSEVPDF